MKIFIRFSFFGQSYYGTQKLPKYKTIQGEFESLLSRIYASNIKVTISSRLDRGVHALDFAITFTPTNEDISIEHLEYYLKRSVSKDICIKKVCKIDDSFSPRYDCLDKQYLYIIQNTSNPNPLLNSISFTPKKVLNVSQLKETIEMFKGIHDFSSFCSKEGDENTLLEVKETSLEQNGDLIFIRFKAKAFLRYQIRFMVGSAISVCLGYMTIEEIKNSLAGKSETHIKFKAEPQGLILEKINYPQIEDDFTTKQIILF